MEHPQTTHLPVAISVGGVQGLALQLTANGGKSWLLRISINRKRRELGLGPYPEVSLAEAREAAAKIRKQVREGLDPTAERAAARAAAELEEKRRMLFEDAVEAYCKTKLEEIGTEKERKTFRNSLHTYAMPVLGKIPVADITYQDMLRVLEPVWREKTTTASRVRGRVERVLTWATIKGYRTGDNPARWQGNLKELLPDPSKIAKTTHYPALAVADAHRFWAALQEQDTNLASAPLIFALLNASRSMEVRAATWDEIQGDTWIIPAERMKMDREHRVPLSNQALAMLDALPRKSHLVFPSLRGKVQADTALSYLMRDTCKALDLADPVTGKTPVPHGMRSTFRQWCAEQNYPREIAELALAHQSGNAVELSYQRSDMLERRRGMMQGWADFVFGANAGKVVRIG